MNNKTILKRIKKEGNMIVPNSFNALLDKVKSTDQYLAYQIKREGEQLVPNNYSSIKKKIKKENKANGLFSFKERFVLVASAFTLVTLIAIPTTIMILNGNRIGNSSNNIIYSNANIKLEIKSKNVATTSGAIKKASSNDTSNEIELRYTIDKEQYTDTDSYLPMTDGAKIALAYLDKTEKIKVNDFTSNVITTCEEQEIVNLDNANIKLEITGVNASYGNYLKEEIKKSLIDKYQDIDISMEEDKDDIDSSTLAKGYELALYVKTLFYKDDEPIEGYVPSELLDKDYDEQYWIDYVSNYSKQDDLDKIISKLKVKYNELQTSSNIFKFQNNLEHMYEVYEERYDYLNDCIEEINEYIEWFKDELDSEAKDDAYYISLCGDAYVNYDLTKHPEWWQNDFLNETYNFNDYKDFYSHRPGEDKWEDQPKPPHSDHGEYPNPRINYKPGYSHEIEKDDEAIYQDYIVELFKFRNDFEKLQYTNIKCFSFTFDILPEVEQMMNNEGYKYDDGYWDDIDYDGPGDDYDDWDDYWKDYHNHTKPYH